MADKDYAIGMVNSPQMGQVSKKPCYLISIDPSNKTMKPIYFISLDKPDLLNGFIQAKGFYCEESKEKIVSNFMEIVRATLKEDLVEMMFPWHKICDVRSLVFNANKPASLINK